MKMVFIVHGFGGWPSGAWRPWLMTELDKLEIYACALSMPSSENPVCTEWIDEIKRQVERNKNHEIYLVGHSLGVTAILRYLESGQSRPPIAGAVLVSGPVEKTKNEKINSFLEKPFDFATIRSKCPKFSIIHGDNDPVVPFHNAEILSKELKGKLIVIANGVHLNGSAGWHILPECLEELKIVMNI